MNDIFVNLISELGFRAKLYLEKETPKPLEDLTQRQKLILEILGIQEGLTISQINEHIPCVKLSTISTTITALLRRSLIRKKIPPENQRLVQVHLTKEGKDILSLIKNENRGLYNKIAQSFSLTPEVTEYLNPILKQSIKSFDELLGIKKSVGV